MNRIVSRVAVAGVFLLLVFGVGIGSIAVAQDVPNTSVNIKLKVDLTTEQQQALVAPQSGVIKGYIQQLLLLTADFPTSDFNALKTALEANTDVVVRVELNRKRQVQAQSDGAPASQWALPKIGWDQVYPTAPAASAIVAILDTGIDASHSDLAGVVVPGTSFIDSSNGMTDANGHGTWLAGIVAANGGIKGVGFAGVQVMPVNVLGANGEGQDADIINGVLYAADHDAKVILMAFSNAGKSESLQEAINYAWGKGAVLVAAVGNDGTADPTFPAGDQSVMGISATDQNDQFAGGNYGSAAFLAAPGVGIIGTGFNGSYVAYSGTSASAAIVAGVAGYMAANGVPNGVIVGRLARTADLAAIVEQTGNGRVNMARAVADTTTDPIQPAGVENGGGPIVSPYRAAAMNITAINVGSQIGSLNYGTVGSVTYTVLVTTSGNGSQGVTAQNLPSGATFTPSTISNNGNFQFTLTITTQITTPAGTFTNLTIKAGGITSNIFTLTIGKATPTVIWSNPADITFPTALSGTQLNATASVPGAFLYTPAAGTILNAGNGQTLSVQFTPTDTANYATPSPKTVLINVAKASSTTAVSCPGGATYSGSALTPCSATVTGAGGLSQSLTVTYSNNTNAGTATASASFGGDSNHTGSSDSKTFAIGQATSTTTLSCTGGPFTYSGSAFTPCTASVMGAGGLSQTLTVGYSNNTNVGTATASANFIGDANHSASSDSKTFTIGQASSTTIVSCAAGPFTYTGSALTPCTATVTGAGGLNESLTVSYSNNTNSGTATASANFAGDANHSASNNSKTFAIGQASSTTTVTVSDVAYDGNTHGGTAAVTGAGGLNQSLTVSYSGRNGTTYGPSTTAPTSAGDYTASASFAGDADHSSSTDSKNYSINQASSTTVVSCPASETFTGSALTPCTAVVTGASGLNQSLTVSYTDNVNVGTATASASFAGDANHSASNDSKTFAIGQASSTTTVTVNDATYDGNTHGGTAAVTGAGGLNQSLTVSYSGRNGTTYGPSTNAPASAGDYTASASFAGDSNHTSSSDSKNYSINKASSTTVVSCPASEPFTGSALTPCSATVTGVGGLSQSLTITYSNNTNVGTATASASFAGDANHGASSDSKTFTIGQATSTTTVSCAGGPFTYSGSALTPCTAMVTGTGGLSQPLTVTYSNNTNAGTATASANFAGDANHSPSSDLKTFAIGQATPTATLAVNNSPQTYSGSPQAASVSILTSSVPGSVQNILTGGAATQSVVNSYAVSADFVPNNGNYITLPGLSAGSFVIGQATPIVSPWPTASNIVAGQTLATSVLSGGAASIAGNFAFTFPATTPGLGTSSQSVRFTPNDTSNYNSVIGSVNVTVVQGTIQLAASAVLTKQGNGTYLATVTVTNKGTITAPNVLLSTAQLNSKNGAPIPQTLGAIGAGGVVTTTVTFPSTAGSSGTSTVLKLGGTYTGGSYQASLRVVLP